MGIDKNISQRIEILRYPLMLAIVFFHAPAGLVFNNIHTSSDIATMTMVFFSWMIGGMGVPFFFLISGYLFFNNYETTEEVYKKKLSNRVRTLLIPFLLWNIIMLAIKIAIFSVPELAHLDTVAGHARLTEPIVQRIMYYIFEFFNTPPIGPFWFIRDLLIYSVISPLIWVVAKKAHWVGLLAMTCVWFFIFQSKVMVLKDIHESLPPFFLGACIWAQKWNIKKIDAYSTIIKMVYIFSVVVLLVLICGNNVGVTKSIIHKLVVMFGILFFWTSVATTLTKKVSMLSKLSNYSFFVFAAHMPFLDLLQRIYLHFTYPRYDAQKLFFYFFTWFVTVVVTTWCAIIARRIMPRVYNVFTGGR